MERTHRDDGSVCVGTRDAVVLVCIPDRTRRTDVASTLREEYAVRTADSAAAAVASLDGSVSVLMVDDADPDMSLEGLLPAREDGDYRFRLVAVVNGSPTSRLREHCHGFVSRPVEDDALRSTVRRVHGLDRYDETLRTYYALSGEYASLQTDPDAAAAELQSLEARLRRLRDELDDAGDALDSGDALDVALHSGEP